MLEANEISERWNSTKATMSKEYSISDQFVNDEHMRTGAEGCNKSLSYRGGGACDWCDWKDGSFTKAAGTITAWVWGAAATNTGCAGVWIVGKSRTETNVSVLGATQGSSECKSAECEAIPSGDFCDGWPSSSGNLTWSSVALSSGWRRR